MNKKRRGVEPPLVSGSSLLVIFAILCLTTFALLSLSTVQAHLRQMNNLNRAVTDYYAADCAAEETFARLRSGEAVENVTETDFGVYRYVVPVSDSQELQVEVSVLGDDCRVNRWQVVSAGEWQPDDDLSVWDGELLSALPDGGN